MSLKILHTVTAESDTERPVPRWALYVAYAIPPMLLPWCLWRLPFAFGFEMGMLNHGHKLPSMWLTIPYVFGLSLFSEGAAFLCLGLVRGWGEVAPTWLPLVGGRRIPPMAAVIPAALGGLAMTAVTVETVACWFGVIPVDGYSNTRWEILATVCTAPGVLWGPMVLALTCSYHLRRRQAG